MLHQSLPQAMPVERFLPPLFDVFGRAPLGHAETVNRDAFDQLVALLQAEAEAPGRCILLRAPRAGYGKTHLLNQVERRLAGSHEFVLLTLADGSRMHAGSVLEDLLRRMCRPLPAAAGLTALDLIARRVLARGLEPLVRSGEVPCQDREGALNALQNRATETFDFHHPNAVTAHWTRENFALLGPRLGLELCETCGGPLREAIGWVEALFRFAAAPVDQPARIGNLIEWSLGGASMDRLACLLRLLAPLHRMVLVADEIEGLSSDPEAGLRLAAFVTSLRQTADRADVVIAVNDDLWEGAIRPRLSGGLEDRLAERVVRLQSLTEEEMLALLENHFPGDGEKLADVLGLSASERYARRVIRRAAEVRDALDRGEPVPHSAPAAVSTTAPQSAADSVLAWGAPAAATEPPPVAPQAPAQAAAQAAATGVAPAAAAIDDLIPRRDYGHAAPAADTADDAPWMPDLTSVPLGVEPDDTGFGFVAETAHAHAPSQGAVASETLEPPPAFSSPAAEAFADSPFTPAFDEPTVAAAKIPAAAAEPPQPAHDLNPFLTEAAADHFVPAAAAFSPAPSPAVTSPFAPAAPPWDAPPHAAPPTPEPTPATASPFAPATPSWDALQPAAPPTPEPTAAVTSPFAPATPSWAASPLSPEPTAAVTSSFAPAAPSWAAPTPAAPPTPAPVADSQFASSTSSWDAPPPAAPAASEPAPAVASPFAPAASSWDAPPPAAPPTHEHAPGVASQFAPSTSPWDAPPPVAPTTPEPSPAETSPFTTAPVRQAPAAQAAEEAAPTSAAPPTPEASRIDDLLRQFRERYGRR